MRPDVVLVVAAATNGVIGFEGKMPWHIPADLKHFRKLTVGKPIIMGRKTFESIGKPLPGRHNIVLTRDSTWMAEGVTIAPHLAEAIAAAGLDLRARADEIMVIGGAEIYRLVMPIATVIELTRIDATPVGDAFFPQPDPSVWAEVSHEVHPAQDETPGFAFIRLERVKSALAAEEPTR